MDRTSKEKRAPTALKVKYRSKSIDQFIEQAGLNISRGGIFVRTKKPMAAGTPLKFEFQLSDSTPVIRGVGRVVWRRENDEDKSHPSGMGVKFLKLDPAGRSLVERIVNERGEVRSRFDADEIGKPTTPKPDASVPPAIPAHVRSKAPLRIDPFDRVPLKKQKSQVQDVGAFLASALSESGVEHKSAAEPVTQTEEKPKSVETDETKKEPSSSFADELFGDIDMPTERYESPILDLIASLSKQPRDAEEEPAPQERFQAPFESESGGDEDENAQEDSAPLFSDRAPRLSGHAPAPQGEEEARNSDEKVAERRNSLDRSAPATPALDGVSQDHPETPGRNLGTYDSEAHRSDVPVETSLPKLDATPPLSLSPPKTKPASSSSKSLFIIGLFVSLFIALIAGAGAYLLLGEDSALKTSGSETIAPEQTAESKTTQVAIAPTVQPSPEPEQLEEQTGTEDSREQAAEQSEGQTELAAVEMTKVQITSVPKNADLVIDGEPRGKTPAKVELPVGKPVTISVKHSGFESANQEITAQKREPAVRFKLVPQEYVLLVRTIPPGAKVTVQQQSVISPATINLGHINGMISVSLSKEGYRPMVLPIRLDQFVEVNNIMSKQLTVKLNPLPNANKVVKKQTEPRTSTTTPTTPIKTPDPKPIAAEAESGTSSEKKPVPSAPKAEAESEPEPEVEPEPEPEPKVKAEPKTAVETKPARTPDDVRPNPY